METPTKCLAYPAAAFKLINAANCLRDWVRRWLQSRRKTIRPAAVEICYVIAENCEKSETFVREWRYLGFLCCFAYQSKSGFTWNSCWKLSRAVNFFAEHANWQEKRQQSSNMMHISRWRMKFLARLQLCKKFHQYFNYFLLCKFYYNILISHKSRFTVGRLYRCIKLNWSRDSRLNRFSNSSRVQFSGRSQHERCY